MNPKITTGLISAGLILMSCSTENESTITTTGSESSFPTLVEFEKSLVKIPGTNKYAYLGDEPIDGKEGVDRYYNLLKQLFDEPAQSGLGKKTVSLVVGNVAVEDILIPNALRQNITFCIDNSFGTNKTKVVNAITQAATLWNTASASSINISHTNAEDGSECNGENNDVYFHVRGTSIPEDDDGITAASSFFPTFLRADRELTLNTDLIGKSQNWWRGIIIHELGHSLGFRHEFVSPGAPLCETFSDEKLDSRDPNPDDGVSETVFNANFRALSGYDASSVMNYTDCGGRTPENITDLSQIDKEVLKKVYGSTLVYTTKTIQQIGIPYSTNYHYGLPSSGLFVTAQGDFNGDGNGDYIRVSRNSIFAYYATPQNGAGTFAHVASSLGVDLGSTHATQWPLFVGDFNGDGRDDFIRYHNTEGVYAFISTANGFTMKAKKTYPLGYNFAPFKAVSGDFAQWSSIGSHRNSFADGFDDIAFFSNSCKFYLLGHNSGELTVAFGGGNCNQPTTWNDYGNVGLGETYSILYNMPGFVSHSALLNLMDTYYTYRGVRFNYENANWNFGAPSTFSTVIGDFNGDGLTDFARLSSTVYFMFLNQGWDAEGNQRRFAESINSWPIATWNFGNPSQFVSLAGDYNRDGIDDIVRISSTGKFTLFGNAQGRFGTGIGESMGSWNFGTNNVTDWVNVQGDFDGNGTTDVARLGDAAFYVMLHKI